ncbi:ABC transporter transmembrane domain-containing protein [Trichococcus sp. K1Tr]|uniref:ABC transporter ATP-binding protein n=1 Tax=Trichococcus sp. K1Tr TaxID=3020847 RepID=UPI00232FEEAC|nr:ABC transporter transmembrane domain-containing protein [Trichococcus sp. K1Tr]MDB6352060.1 ABC transporter transmembrane domain-containing protein [Trichococcus sp. K1Tr]
MSIFKKLSWFFRQEWKSYFVGVFFLIIVAILQVVSPRVVGIIIDEIALGTLTMASLWKWSAVILIAGILQYLFRYIWRMKIWGTSAELEKILRSRLFKHFTEMDAVFFQKYRTGDLMAHATNDLNAIRMVAGAGILTLADSISSGGITLFTMFFLIDWRLTLIAMIPLPALTLVSRILGQKMHKRFRKAQAAFSNLNDKTQESVSGVKVIKTFGEEEEDIHDFEAMTKDVVAKNKAVYLVDALFDPAIQLILGLSFALTIIFGGRFVVEGSISIGQLVSFISYIGMMAWPMLAVGRLFNVLERGSASYSRIDELLKEKSTIQEQKDAIRTPVTGDLDFQVSSFGYPNSEEISLQDVNFHLERGQTLGIVGRTGSGKSTIFRLLLREYDQYAGSINYNGIDIRDYSLDALLSGIGYVPQDNFLFSSDVRENIRFADPSISQQKVEEAARLTAIHQDILGFPDGYDTLVGERGVSLSGGQKQRIAIARALVTEPELLILDDSLSAVDAKTEEAILTGLKEKRADQTTIIAAHRISSVMHANEIIVLDEGRIVERGTHYELMEQDGWYRRMYEKQQLETKLEGADEA